MYSHPRVYTKRLFPKSFLSKMGLQKYAVVSHEKRTIKSSHEKEKNSVKRGLKCRAL